MIALFIIGALALVLFAGIVVVGAPYLPTSSKRVDDALELLDLKPGQTMLELGSGDGRLLKAAAKKGIHAVGYELNPVLVLYSKISTWRYRAMVKIHFGNYWNQQWPKADGMYVFLLQPYMSKLHTQILAYEHAGVLRLVSHEFRIPEKKTQQEHNDMFLYVYK